MLKKVILLLLALYCLINPASAFWEQTFENTETDAALSDFITEGSISSFENNNVVQKLNTVDGLGIRVDIPYSGYVGFATRIDTQNTGSVILTFDIRESAGNTVKAVQYTVSDFEKNQWHWIEIIENVGQTGFEIWINGVKKSTILYGETFDRTGDFSIGICGPYQVNCNLYIDSITCKSAHSVIDCDNAVASTDSGQIIKVCTPGQQNIYTSYILKIYSPKNERIYQNTFNETFLSTEIAKDEITDIGDYTAHLYKKVNDTQSFLCMKSFSLSNSEGGTGTGTIDLEKTEYELGENVEFWIHLDNYAPGYNVVCEFGTSGMNLRKEVLITDDTFKGSFTIPETTDCIGSHTVNLFDPDGNLVDSEEFSAFKPGVADIALDKDQYERTDTAKIYYRDLENNSEISVVLRYGGITAYQTNFILSRAGTLNVNLSVLPAADSIYIICKDSDGITRDRDTAKIIVGNYQISGRVYNAGNGEIIPNVTVTIQGNSILTDENGNYNLSALAGFANYSLTKTGFEPASGTVAVFDLDTIHNFYMTKIIENGGTGVHGTVSSYKTGEYLRGASVVAVNNDNEKRFSTIANQNGYYEINNVDLAGNVTLTVSNSNYDTITAETVINEGSLNNLNFRLNAVSGYEEIIPGDHSGGQDGNDETAEERAYREKYGEMGKHPFDFDGNGKIENSEWKYACEYLGTVIGILSFMGFLTLINRRR